MEKQTKSSENIKKKLGFNISIFTLKEEYYLDKFRQYKDKLLKSLIVYLFKKKVSSNFISAISFLQIIPFIYFIKINLWISFLFLIFSFILDSIDGPLARYKAETDKDNSRDLAQGKFIDLAADNFFFFGVVLAFIYFKLIDGFWGSFYLFNYIFLIVFALVIHLAKQSLMPVLKSKYLFYLCFFILIISSQNFFDPFLVLFSIYMFITNLFLFNRVRCLI